MLDERISPIKALNFIRENAEKYAIALGNVTYMREFRKSLKCLKMAECQAETIGAKEIYAYAHPDYIAHLEALKQAIIEAETLRWLIIGAEAKIEVWRSMESSARLENRYSSVPEGNNYE